MNELDPPTARGRDIPQVPSAQLANGVSLDSETPPSPKCPRNSSRGPQLLPFVWVASSFPGMIQRERGVSAVESLVLGHSAWHSPCTATFPSLHFCRACLSPFLTFNDSLMESVKKHIRYLQLYLQERLRRWESSARHAEHKATRRGERESGRPGNPSHRRASPRGNLLNRPQVLYNQMTTLICKQEGRW